ncbi:MAG: ABC transporter ATP-binding protein [Devosiaceae bacterium]|nr:ABC transporter ATP-binding protein [Devosiaceae bacterium]
MSALIVENVNKQYGSHRVVKNISLKIEAGERVALLGHNGAGKTTLIKMMLGLVPISSGTISMLGEIVGSRKARKLSGYLPENVAFHGSLTGREQMHHFAALKSIAKKTADEILERVGLSHAIDRRIGTYSKGMRQRVGLAQALLGKPKLVLLDEPTSGLDPISRHDFYDIIEELSGGGTMVLISSHALTEMETRMDRIVIMSNGQMVANDRIENLRQHANLPIRINIMADEKSAALIAKTLSGKRINGHIVELFCNGDEKINLLKRISNMKEKISDIDIAPASLEELYRFYSAPQDEEGEQENV